jgi:hypothetical protein
VPQNAHPPPGDNGNEPQRDVLVRTTGDALHDHHPVPGQVHQTYREIERVIADAVDPAEFAAGMLRNHAGYRAYWAEHPKAYIPPLWRWIRDGDYLKPPAKIERDGY